MPRIPTAPRRRKKRTQEELLQIRLQHYEALLKANGISPEATTLDDGSNDSEGETEATFRNMSISESTADQTDKLLKSWLADPQGKIHVDRRGKSTFVDNNLYVSLDDEIDHEENVPTESEDEEAVGVLGDPFRVDLILGAIPHLPVTITIHPSPDHALKLWQIFKDNVNPVIKILHIPSVQSKLRNATQSPEKVDKHFETLMFAVYAVAIESLSDDECQEEFRDEKTALFARFLFGVRQGLMNNRFLGTSEMMVLQAFTLYVMATRGHYRPRSTWVLAGVASRIAEGMGLHKDGLQYGLSLFESEMRRRLWWQISILNGRSAEMAGTSSYGSMTSLFELPPPMNVNDDELYPEMTERPPESNRATEMTPFLLRYEMARIRIKILQKQWPAEGDKSIEEIDKVIDEFQDSVGEVSKSICLAYTTVAWHLLTIETEERVMKYLDPTKPAEFQSLLVGRTSIYILRFFAHHPRYVQQEYHMASEYHQVALP